MAYCFISITMDKQNIVLPESLITVKAYRFLNAFPFLALQKATTGRTFALLPCCFASSRGGEKQKPFPGEDQRAK